MYLMREAITLQEAIKEAIDGLVDQLRDHQGIIKGSSRCHQGVIEVSSRCHQEAIKLNVLVEQLGPLDR
jgi:hypothetical protein